MGRYKHKNQLKKLHILLVEPSGAGGLAHFTFKLLGTLAESVENLCLLTAHPYELSDVVDMNRLVLIRGRLRGKGFLIKLFNRTIGQLLFLCSLFVQLYKHKDYKIIITSQPKNITLFPLLAVLFLFNRKPLFCLHDIVPHNNQRFQPFLNKIVILLSGKVVVMAEDFVEQASQYYRLSQSKFVGINLGSTCIYNNPTIPKQIFRNTLSIPKDAFVFLFFGTIAKYKGIEFLISSFGLVVQEKPNAILFIAGNLSKEIKNKELLGWIKENKIENNVICTLEYIPPKRHANVFHASDCVVLPYKDSTNGISQSGILLESLEFSRPVIATNVAAIGEGVINNFNGFLIDSFEPKVLADGMLRMIEISENQLIEMGENSYNLLNKKFSWRKIGEKYLAVIQEI